MQQKKTKPFIANHLFRDCEQINWKKFIPQTYSTKLVHFNTLKKKTFTYFFAKAINLKVKKVKFKRLQMLKEKRQPNIILMSAQDLKMLFMFYKEQK